MFTKHRGGGVCSLVKSLCRSTGTHLNQTPSFMSNLQATLPSSSHLALRAASFTSLRNLACSIAPLSANSPTLLTVLLTASAVPRALAASRLALFTSRLRLDISEATLSASTAVFAKKTHAGHLPLVESATAAVGCLWCDWRAGESPHVLHRVQVALRYHSDLAPVHQEQKACRSVRTGTLLDTQTRPVGAFVVILGGII